MNSFSLEWFKFKSYDFSMFEELLLGSNFSAHQKVNLGYTFHMTS